MADGLVRVLLVGDVVGAPDRRLILKLAIASDRWLHENWNPPDGSMVKLRG